MRISRGDVRGRLRRAEQRLARVDAETAHSVTEPVDVVELAAMVRESIARHAGDGTPAGYTWAAFAELVAEYAAKWCCCDDAPAVALDWGDESGDAGVCPRCGRPVRRAVVEWNESGLRNDSE